MKIVATAWFETIHPMSYLFVLQSVMWGIMVMMHAVFDFVNILRVGDMFWPEVLTYFWALLVIAGGITLLWFFIRDRSDKKRDRIWTISRVNLAFWTFAMVTWVVLPGSQVIVLIAFVNVLGWVYLCLAPKLSRKSHRV